MSAKILSLDFNDAPRQVVEPEDFDLDALAADCLAGAKAEQVSAGQDTDGQAQDTLPPSASFAVKEEGPSCFHPSRVGAWEDCTAGKLRSGDLPPLDWTFPGFQLTHNISLLVGLPGTGKSYFANQLGAYVASGRGCEGIFDPGGVRGKVLILAGEEDERIVPRRVRALGDALFPAKGSWIDFNREAEEIEFNQNLIVKSLAGESLRLLDRSGPGAPYRTQVYDELLDFCKTIPNLQLIVMDPLSRFMGIEENDNGDGTEFITALEHLSISVGASIVCVHHVGKGGKTWLDSLALYAARGASGLVGAVRGQMNIVALTKKEAKDVIDPPEEPRNGEYLALAFPKISYGPGRGMVFLHRGENGILSAVDPKEKSADELQIEDAILKWIKAKIAEQESKGLPSLTVKSVTELTKEWSCILGASKAKVKDVANAAIVTGELFLESAKNSRGRAVEYLRLEPEKIPASTPASETPATPAESGHETLAGV